MKCAIDSRRLVILTTLVLALAGCDDGAPPTPKAEPGASKKAVLGKNVSLEIQGDRRRVLIQGHVCLREGQLEHLMCLVDTKEHEAIIAADCDARVIHAALEAAGAKAGSPVRWEPKFQPPTGTPVRISIQYEKDGEVVTVPARDWIRHVRTKKNLDVDWVFAGSQLIRNPNNPQGPPFYRGNEGDVICVINRDNAVLDLPIYSPKALDDRIFEAHTDRIPPLKTKVVVILEPIREEKK
ncbi:MAG: YdjY domain-containing protein [Gemmataceae bacterium]|nr:YdjY domain-containing protein [Gemmataceae bacterium]MDW8265595.1 YdjY domain-containing protein [Gemmataceae bacterium]